MTPKTVKGQGALKVSKESHLIKKSTSSSSSVSKPQQRQPVIIYTHNPRVIQTHPSNFMELVQKLTGLSRSDRDEVNECKQPPPPRKEENEATEENEASVITTEELDSCNCVGSEVKSSFVALEPPMMPDYVNMFAPDFLCSSKPLFNFTDPSFMF